MKSILFLLLSTTTMCWAQRDFPRWQEEAIVHDLIRGRGCDSAMQHALKINNDLRVELKAWKKTEEELQSVIFDYEHTVVPGLEAKVFNAQKEGLVYKSEAQKNRRQRNTVIAIFVVVEVIRILSGHP